MHGEARFIRSWGSQRIVTTRTSRRCRFSSSPYFTHSWSTSHAEISTRWLLMKKDESTLGAVAASHTTKVSEVMATRTTKTTPNKLISSMVSVSARLRQEVIIPWSELITTTSMLGDKECMANADTESFITLIDRTESKCRKLIRILGFQNRLTKRIGMIQTLKKTLRSSISLLELTIQ